MTEDLERDAELRRRLTILRDQMKAGEVGFAEHLQDGAEESLLAIKTDQNGEIDLSTVDGRARSLAMAVSYFSDREDMKDAAPMSDVQEMYFEHLERNFGPFFQKMHEEGLDPHMAAVALASDDKFLEANDESIMGFCDAVIEFWQNVSEPAHAHVEDVQEIKMVYGGSLFPTYTQNIASTCGLYADSIVLPDPFLRSAGLFEHQTSSQRAYFVIKNALNLLDYKDLALADVEQRIVSILPDRSFLDEDERQVVAAISEDDALQHLKILFEQPFESLDEYFDYVKPLDTIDKLAERLAVPDRALIDTDWPRNVNEQLARGLEEGAKEHNLAKHPGQMLVLTAIGRMMQANDLLLRSQRLDGTPLIDAPTSWQYFQWKLEYDSARFDSNAINHLHITRGLQAAAATEMEWLGRVPPDALIEIRATGALEEIRGILGRGVSEIAHANPDNFYRTSDQIVENIHNAFDVHRANLKDLTGKKWKFAGKDIGSWLAVGTLEVAAAATGAPMYGLISLAANQLIDMPKIKDFPAKIEDLKKESEKVKRSPVGLLFALKDD
jgi:hypothetical protein